VKLWGLSTAPSLIVPASEPSVRHNPFIEKYARPLMPRSSGGIDAAAHPPNCLTTNVPPAVPSLRQRAQPIEASYAKNVASAEPVEAKLNAAVVLNAPDGPALMSLSSVVPPAVPSLVQSS
jgi:hypothetical protein